MIIVSTLNN